MRYLCSGTAVSCRWTGGIRSSGTAVLPHKNIQIGFLDDWNKRRDHKQRIYISYDSSNKNCNAGDIELIEYGKAKDDKGIPIFNLALAFDKTNRVPLFYEEYPGSITDVSQFVRKR